MSDNPNSSSENSNLIVLDYGVVRKVGSVSIEMQADGVVIRALISPLKLWLKIIFNIFLGLFFSAVALPGNDDYPLFGGNLHREGMAARIISAVLVLFFFVNAIYLYIFPRIPDVLQITKGTFIYSEPRLSSFHKIECPLSGIELLEYVPQSGDDKALMRVKQFVKEQELIFSRYGDKELKAISEIIIPLWEKNLMPRS